MDNEQNTYESLKLRMGYHIDEFFQFSDNKNLRSIKIRMMAKILLEKYMEISNIILKDANEKEYIEYLANTFSEMSNFIKYNQER